MLLPVDDAKQQCHHERVDHDRDENVFDSLFNVPSPLLVSLTGIPSVNPGKEGRAQCGFPKRNHADSQHDCEDDEKRYYLKIKPFHSQTSIRVFPCFHGLKTVVDRG